MGDLKRSLNQVEILRYTLKTERRGALEIVRNGDQRYGDQGVGDQGLVEGGRDEEGGSVIR